MSTRMIDTVTSAVTFKLPVITIRTKKTATIERPTLLAVSGTNAT